MKNLFITNVNKNKNDHIEKSIEKVNRKNSKKLSFQKTSS